MARKILRSTATELNAVMLAVSVLVLVVMLGLTTQEWRRYELARTVGARTLGVRNSVDRLLTNLLDAETGQRGFLLTGDERYLQPYNGAIQAIPSELDTLNKLLPPSLDQQGPRAAQLTTLVHQKLTEFQESIDLRRRQGTAPAREVVLNSQGRQVMDRIRGICAAIRSEAASELNENRTQAQTASARNLLVTITGSAVLLLFFVIGSIKMKAAILGREEALLDAQDARDSLRTTLESIGDAVISTDAKGRILFANKEAQALLRTPEADLAGKPLDEVFHVVNELSRDKIESPVARVLREGVVVSLANHAVLMARDGTEIPIDDSGAPVRGENGAIRGTVLVFRDITGKRQAEKALLESEQRFRSIADTAPVMMWASGLDKRLTWFNRTWLDFTGRTLEQEMGEGWAAGVHPDDQERCLAIYAAAFDRRDAFQIEYRLRRRDGQWRWIIDQGVPFKYADGSFRGYIGTCVDIHETRQAEEVLRNTNAALQEYADIVDPGAVLVRDPSDHIIRWTSGAEALYGVSASKAIGAISHDLFHTRFPEPLDQIKTKLFADGRWEGELRHRRPDGREVVVESIWALHRDKLGEPAAILEINTDVTERKHAEEKFRMAVEAAPNGMVLTDEEGKILLVNSEMQRLFGYTREELIGQSIDLLVPRQYGDQHRKHREAFYTDPQARRMGAGRDLRARRKGGGEFPVEIALNPIQTSEGRLVLSAIVDITERQRMEQERLELLATERALTAEQSLRESEAELARVARALSVGELAASIAHEINQPLAGVVTNAEAGLRWLGSQTPNIQEARDSLALIIRDGNRASEVIRRIRDFLKKGNQETTALDVNQVIREALALAGSELMKRRIPARTALSAELPRVRGDKIQLQQVILNLIMNGAESMASPNGSKELLLTSKRYLEPGGPPFVLVGVQDSGIGVEPADMQKMFGVLFTTKASGMGMGLSICRSIVEAHGGRIWAEANHGAGLTVQFCLPCDEE